MARIGSGGNIDDVLAAADSIIGSVTGSREAEANASAAQAAAMSSTDTTTLMVAGAVLLALIGGIAYVWKK